MIDVIYTIFIYMFPVKTKSSSV